jgi:hypothetical protein
MNPVQNSPVHDLWMPRRPLATRTPSLGAIGTAPWTRP